MLWHQPLTHALPGEMLARTPDLASLVLQVAVALQLKVYVEQDKWNVLRCLDMRVRERLLLTRNINEAGIHVVPLRRVRFCNVLAAFVCMHRLHNTAGHMLRSRARSIARCSDDAAARECAWHAMLASHLCQACSCMWRTADEARQAEGCAGAPWGLLVAARIQADGLDVQSRSSWCAGGARC
jgi:hypothetical protein